jgi:hypothetical protein
MVEHIEPIGQTNDIPQYTLRLTLAYEGMEIRLVAGQRVEMIPPRGESERIQLGQPGYWVELRNAHEQILYQSILHYPIRYMIEVPGDPDTGVMRWEKVNNPRGIIQLLVPDIPEARILILFGSPPAAPYEPSTELARFNLDLKDLKDEARR